MKKVILMVGMFLILCSSIYAATSSSDLTPYLKSHWKFEDTATSENSLFDLTLTGTTYSSSGYDGKCLNTSAGTTDGATYSSWIQSADETHCFRFKPSAILGSGNPMIWMMSDGTTSNYNWLAGDDARKIYLRIDSGATADNVNILPSITNWNFFCLAINTTSNAERLYFNYSTDAYYNTYSETITHFGNKISIGKEGIYAADSYGGCYDDWMVFNKSLTNEEMSFLASNVLTIDSSNFQITANATYWGANLQTFYANVNGTPYTTTNGTIVTNLLLNSSFLHNASIWAVNYSNSSQLNINVSTDLEVQLDYDNYFVNISISDELGSRDNFNLILNGTFFSTENGSIVTDTTKNAYYNISVHNMTTYIPFSEIVFIDWWVFQLNYSINTTVYNLNVTSYSDFGGTIINDFNVSAILVSNGTQTNATTTVGSVKLSLVPNEDYNIIINSDTYAQSNYTINMDNVSKLLNATLTLDALTGIFNCNSTLNTTSINFTIRDEDNNHQLLSVSVNGIVTLTDILGVQKNITFNRSSTQSFKLCINPNNKFFYSDIFLEYEPISTLGYKERYYIENITLTNTTQFKTLYNFNTTTTSTVLQGTAADFDSEKDFPNLIAKLLRFYPADNEWKLVQVDKTDNFGNFFFYIKERDTRYNIVFEENNLELKRTESLSFQCDVVTGLCEIKFLVPSTSSVVGTSDIAFDISFDEDTNLITVFWNDPTLKTSEVRVEITKNTPSGRNTLFNQTSTSQTGSFVYNATGQKGTLVIKAYSSSSDELAKAIKYIQIATRKLWGILDDNQAGGKFAAGFWGIGIILTSVGATLWAPTAALIGLFLGALIMFFITGFNFITTSFLVSLAIGIIIVMIKVKK